MPSKQRYVDTQRGKAKVNWYRGGKLGVTYLKTDSDLPESDILLDTEVEFNYGEIEPDTKKDDVRDMEYTDLKSRVKQWRRTREGEK